MKHVYSKTIKTFYLLLNVTHIDIYIDFQFQGNTSAVHAAAAATSSSSAAAAITLSCCCWAHFLASRT